MQATEFRVLGPFEVRQSADVLADGAGRRQALLAMLLVSANRTVSADRLASGLWGEDQPSSAANLVQGYVSHWRTVLDPGRGRRATGDRLTSSGGGYCLHVSEQECDLLRFRARAREGLDAVALGDLYAARRLLHAAVGERRGPALVEFTQSVLADAAATFEAEWLTTVEAAAEVELRLGRPDSAMTQLDPLLDAHPMRESLVALRMQALYRLGRQAEALDTYERARHALADELGVDPGPELSRMHLDILQQSPTLEGAGAAEPRPPVLPSRLSSFIGREQLRDEVGELLMTHRLVTLTGPAGSGKTRLAVEVAAAVAAAGDRSVTFVDLAPVREAGLLWQTAIGALGRPAPATSEVNAVVGILAALPATLLVLDNLEHLLDAAPALAEVLAQIPLLSVLATSREPLGISGEQLVPVAPLATPEPGDSRDAVLGSPAVRLFIARAKEADPAFVVRDPDVAVLAGVCRRLDGLPLTIELAAPLTSTLTLRALLERLDRPVALLGGRRRGGDQPARHQTLRAALDWSYGTLAPTQRRLFEQLSVFVSGARLEQVEQVSDLGADTALVLAQLHERNLLYRSGSEDAPRYRQLVTIRDYAAERLAEDPAARAAILERHTRSVCDLAEQVSRAARSAAGAALVQRLREEQDEVRSVLARLADPDGGADPAKLLALVVDCLPLWWDLGYTREGYELVTDALAAAPGDTPDELRAAANLVAVFLAEAIGRPETALDLGAEAARCAQMAGSGLLQALCLCVRANSQSWLRADGPTRDDIEMFERALALGRHAPESPARWGWASRSAVLVMALLTLSDLLRYRDARRAHDHMEELLGIYDPDADAYTGSFVLRAAGSFDADAGDWDRAEQRLTASLALANQAASLRSQSRSLEELARLSWRRGDVVAATEPAESATRLARETGHTLNLVRCAALAADIALEVGDLARADALLGQAETADDSRSQRFKLQKTAPRRARLVRLSGRPDDAERHLQAVVHLERATGLLPDRVVYLLEAAYSARHRGDHDRARAMVDALRDAVAAVGLDLALPERRYLDDVTDCLPEITSGQ
ncbi:BTAD domain-containing putative transcriptional regulator [Angustibacter sp. McL0619]|uniref:BTAD domain-containing putative transcriptional regulator n=1 Tax=Angustibacter sp. McL0619 TaxID=3415676 RepID=UPI003CEF925B